MASDSLRRAYAEEIGRRAGAPEGPIVEAFARVPRERFLGPRPWKVIRLSDDEDAAWSEPAAGEGGLDDQLKSIYDDVLVTLDSARKLNNGQPSAHALWIGAVAPRAGESVLHIGCGTGYYSAIFAELVGSEGRVTAVEIEEDLAPRARANLAPWPNARVVRGDGSKPGGTYDVIYVNAGATHARKEWLSALAAGGRMMLPLTVHASLLPSGHGGSGFVICTRRSNALWPVRTVSSVGIYDCFGARDDEAEAQLRRLMRPGARGAIRFLSAVPHPRDEDCLLHVEGFCLRRR